MHAGPAAKQTKVNEVTDQLPAPQQQPGPTPDQTADQGQPAVPEDIRGEEEEEARHSGHVKRRVYTAYAMAAGPFLVSVILVSLTLMQVKTTVLMYCFKKVQRFPSAPPINLPPDCCLQSYATATSCHDYMYDILCYLCCR